MALANVLPTSYEHYTAGGIHVGLNADKPYFTLNERNITIYSGAVHYFRVPKPYWRDRLRKLRAAGLNTVETYVPWNLHEPQPGWFDFGQGGSDMQDLLAVEEFLKIAKEEDLFAIVRPGPFICSEWEFGGLPSWLLREKNIKVRTSDEIFMKYVTRYFNVLLPLLALLQFTRGGPIIAFQVENEYGSTSNPGKFIPDRNYLRQLHRIMTGNGLVELLVTSDSPTLSGTSGTLPGVFLQTANFGGNPKPDFDKLKELQPNRPIMAMEFWTGWFDHWSETHHTRGDEDFYNTYELILKYPASVNMYMFHGGTSFGFMNGANLENSLSDNSGFQPDTTSYDYDSPLSESGDYTLKYVMVKELLEKYNPVKTRIPQTPHQARKISHEPQEIQSHLPFNALLNLSPKLVSQQLVPMENLPINNMSGQSYGYIVYRKRLDIPANSTLTIGGRICDTLIVLINGNMVTKPVSNVNDLNKFGSWRLKNSKLSLGTQNLVGATLDLLVENWGRVNFGYLDQFNQYKGLWQDGVYLNNKQLSDWEIFPLEFKRAWTRSLSGWKAPNKPPIAGPALYKTRLFVNNTLDTYLDMSDWYKGIVIVNDFVLGRYSRIGPQQSLYLPGPFLQQGWNDIIVFEHYIPAKQITFSIKPIYKTRFRNKALQLVDHLLG
ncbi:unnamed protein product [Phaedon cochleariae]|uniref:Beta-galactosidase n=1 Tax=Phaedon cochleariae TaxID=80249 RepID=A0A9N9SAI5_PHACE|nr:unnamed protein product [Phaedon cochleariae]